MKTERKQGRTPFYEAASVRKEDALYAVWGLRLGDTTYRDKITVTGDFDKANAIADAINAAPLHGELVDALVMMLEVAEYAGRGEAPACRLARAVLAKSGGRE